MDAIKAINLVPGSAPSAAVTDALKAAIKVRLKQPRRAALASPLCPTALHCPVLPCAPLSPAGLQFRREAMEAIEGKGNTPTKEQLENRLIAQGPTTSALRNALDAAGWQPEATFKARWDAHRVQHGAGVGAPCTALSRPLRAEAQP